jgi:hypothetical protein
MIRVGRITYVNGKKNIPHLEGWETIEVMTKCSKYSSLSPYCLKNEQGQLMENIWQFSKVYADVPRSIQRYSRYDKTVIWDHPKETHLEEDELTPEYFAWREKGMNAKYPIRYPVGFKYRSKCLFAIKNTDEDEMEVLDYIESRKEIYLPVYNEMVKVQKQYKELREKLKNGKKLLIVEVDGPHQESLQYYKKKYGVTDDFIENKTILINKENMDIMLNDEKHPFGHGYCLGMSLLSLV